MRKKIGKLAFAPLIDIPLIGITLVIFIFHFNRWACRKDLQTNANLVDHLPAARLRVIVFLVGFLLLCLLADFAVWPLFALLIGVGFAIAVVLGWEVEAAAYGLFAVAWCIREWAFGFPQLVLHPTRQVEDSGPTNCEHSLLDKSGTTLSPLRPVGEACIEGTTVTVGSDDGCLIEASTHVIVTSYRNGRLYVRRQRTTPDV